ncbi:hypothetical protein ACIBSS_30865 [Micromonospora aurantiaca]|uniref:hypothetical protein n=1 Tax=Micromonospora aurantiaca (nom. illeg.) TaxID=47850 RepID=UPI00340718B4
MGRDAVWKSIFDDRVLSRPPSSGSPGNVPAGGDLRLDIGWDRFEQLLVFVAQGVLGLGKIRFRRYGVAGQAQHGIDLAGRHPDGTYTVVQCKQYETFTPADLYAAVRKFTEGKRPFDAKHLIVATSAVTRTTQIEDELSDLQDEHTDIEIELWGAEQINDVLRERADIVSRFWTRETAEVFCTGAPLPGVAAPPPNWVRMADQILLTPLGVDGLDEQLAEADQLSPVDPTVAASIYQRLADRVSADGFTGHAHVLRRKQLEALADASMADAAAALAADLAATALHQGDMHQAGYLRHRLDKLARDAAAVDTATARHVLLINAAVTAAEHPLGGTSELLRVLRDSPANVEPPDYQPLLVLMLAELSMADAVINPPDQRLTDAGAAVPADPIAARLAELDDLITSAVTQLAQTPRTAPNKNASLRLRLARASYNLNERMDLLKQARQLRLPRHHTALVLAAQARREALDGSAAEATEYWRQAVGHAIHEGLTDEAAGWLYAIRAVNARYGPWTDRLDEEHLLAQALPKTGSGQLIGRVRDPATDARRAALAHRSNPAITAARRWLADCIVTGAWSNETSAVELLGDLYAQHTEPVRAVSCYQWAGDTKKAVRLADIVGDRLLPKRPATSGPWWQQVTSLATLATQQDLVDDETAAELLHVLLDLVARGRSGELVDSPTYALTLEATKTACALAGRGSSDDARALLDLFAVDIPRAENEFRHHDEQHVQACLAITVRHPELTWLALERIIDLAEVGTDEALKALPTPRFVELLHDPAPQAGSAPAPEAALTASQRQRLQKRLQAIAAAGGRYEAGIAVAKLGMDDPATTQRAINARDRLLSHTEPDGSIFTFGGQTVPDSYLVSFLDPADQQACLTKLLAVAADRRETAQSRQDALTAAANLTLDQDDDVKLHVHTRSRAFVTGTEDGSALDAETTKPHPLSTLRINFGSPSLRAAGLRLAACSAVHHDDRMWVRDQAAVMLGAEDETLVRQAAVTLSQLGPEIIAGLDASLLVGHSLPIVRELAAFIAAEDPVRYAGALERLAADPDRRVRIQLAQKLHHAENDPRQPAHAVIAQILHTLSTDVRHSVRRAALGFGT